MRFSPGVLSKPFQDNASADNRRNAPPITLGARFSWSKLPDTFCVSGQQLCTLILADAFQQGVGRSNPCHQAATKRADRPVTAPDNTVPAECLNGVLGPGAQGFGNPAFRIGIGYDPGDLGADIGAFRE